MKRLNLMVDIDEVLFPLGDSIHALAHEAGLHDNSEPWLMWEAYLQYGCEPDVYWDLWGDFAAAGGYAHTPPIPGSVEALRHLYFEGHTINLVTARGFMKNAENIRRWTPEWIEEFAVPHHTLTFAKDKVAAQAELGAYDVAIDDSPKNYLALEDAGVNVWMQTHSHNQAFDATCRVRDVWQWAAIVDKVAAS